MSWRPKKGCAVRTQITCEEITLRWWVLKHAGTFGVGEQVHVGVAHVVVVVPGLAGEG